MSAFYKLLAIYDNKSKLYKNTIKSNESTNFLVREYANCMCFVDPFNVKMPISVQHYITM